LARAWAAVLAVTLGLAVAAGAAAGDDVFLMRNGDRITGRTLHETSRQFTVQTSYGRVTIPRARIHKILRAGGREETLNPLDGSTGVATGAKPARLVLIVTGHSFWYAWEGKETPAPDPRLRLEVSLDEETAVAYVDATPDPEEFRNALVNAFSFTPEDVTIEAGEGITALPAETRPGRISLKLDVPPAPAGDRRLRVAYQLNDGTDSEPAWRDLVTASASVFLQAGEPTFLQLRQDRGRMEFSGFPKRRMRNVETFKIELAPD
jgi:hypothetical protein